MRWIVVRSTCRLVNSRLDLQKSGEVQGQKGGRLLYILCYLIYFHVLKDIFRYDMPCIHCAFETLFDTHFTFPGLFAHAGAVLRGFLTPRQCSIPVCACGGQFYAT